MANTLTLKSAVNLTDKFIEKVCQENYKNHDKLDGKQLTSITPFKEFNFILLYILLQSWKNEAKKLRSPYFDFDHEESRDALKKFMNVLSRHVSIAENDFKPLAKKSFQLTLLYYNDVLSFLGEVFSSKISLNELLELNKFLKSEWVQHLIEYMDTDDVKELNLDEIELNVMSYPNTDEFLKKLEAYVGGKIENSEKKEADSESNTDTDADVDTPSNPFTGERAGEEESKPGTRAEAEAEAETETEESINKKYEGESTAKPTVHDSLSNHSQKSSKTVLESVSMGRSRSIKESIPLNQQLMITNSVFEGNKEDYIFFIDGLENAENYEKAKHILKSNVPKSEKIVEYEYLKNLLRQKFPKDKD